MRRLIRGSGDVLAAACVLGIAAGVNLMVWSLAPALLRPLSSVVSTASLFVAESAGTSSRRYDRYDWASVRALEDGRDSFTSIETAFEGMVLPDLPFSFKLGAPLEK